MTRMWTAPRAAGTLGVMTRSRTLLACALCLLATAAFPAVGSAQTAAQDQYSGVAGTTANSPTNPPSGVAGQTASGTAKNKPSSTPSNNAPSGTSGEVASNGTLPFTGRDLVLMVLAGLALVGLGVALRSATRRSPAGA
jgi:hypothetical protein